MTARALLCGKQMARKTRLRPLDAMPSASPHLRRVIRRINALLDAVQDEREAEIPVWGSVTRAWDELKKADDQHEGKHDE